MAIITVVEPHPLLRLGILQLLSDVVPGVTLEGSDYSLLFSDAESEARPSDLLLLSVTSFDELQNLISAAESIRTPKSILLLSETSDLPSSLPCLPRSVAGYVQKNASPLVLQASVRLVLAGGTCFPMRLPVPDRPDSLVTHYQPDHWPIADKSSKVRIGVEAQVNEESAMLGLTPRQYEVLVLLARGHPMKTVGRYLNISVATAKAHTEMLYQRLDVHNRNAAVYAAVSRGATLGWPAQIANQYAQADAR